MADLDADGKADLISGSYAGIVYWWPAQKTGFGERRELVRLAHPAFKDPHVACHVVDWDGDGDFDLLLGARAGGVLWARNRGTKQKASFERATPVATKKGPVVVPGRGAGPHAADWDLDGDLDLLVGDDKGSVWLYRNSGTRRTPELPEVAVLLAKRGSRLVEPKCKKRELCAARAKPWVADWNGDGRPDLLVGDFHEHRTEGRMDTKFMHGWVWLYLRKPAKSRDEPKREAPKSKRG